MKLKRLVDNMMGSMFKRTINDNVDTTNSFIQETFRRLEAINNRINNVVVKSGGDSPTEIVDAHLDAEGNVHDTLFDRLKADYSRLLSKINTNSFDIKEVNRKLVEIENTLDGLYGGANGEVIVYVSEAGSNKTGDGTENNPYRSIQHAVDTIPTISRAYVYIEVEPGRYLEDVIVRNRVNPNFEIRATNRDMVNPHVGDTGVFVRSVRFFACSGRCAVIGVTWADSANAPIGMSSNPYNILFQRVGYGSVGLCRATEHTRGAAFSAIQYDGSTGRVFQSHFSNQNYVMFNNFISKSEFADSNTGSNNGVVVHSRRSIAFASGLQVTGDTQVINTVGGQTFQ